MRWIQLIIIGLMTTACATSDKGRMQLVAPREVGHVYSEIDVRTRLALAGERPCSEEGCESAAAFRRQVDAAGASLAKAAYVAYPDLAGRIRQFEFSVPTRGQIGTLSNGGGKVIIFDGLSELAMDDAALNFVIAREMGHVIGRHHDENSAWSIVISVAAQLLLPVANIVRGAAAAIPLNSGIAATTTAASMVGSRVLKAVNRPDQRDEADLIAMKLLRQAGWDLEEVGRSVDSVLPKLARIGDDGWIAELRLSQDRLVQLDCGTSGTPFAETLAVVPPDVSGTLVLSTQ